MIPALLASSLASGLLLAGTLRVHGGLAWLVAAPFALLARDRVRWTHAVLFGAIFADTVGLAVHTGWLAATAERYFGASSAQSGAAAILLIVPTGIVHGALLALAMRAALRLPGLWRIAAGGAVWAAWDWLVLQLFPYYAWAPVAAAQADVPAALGAAFFVGQVGLTFAIAATGLALGCAASRPEARLRAAGAAIAVVAVVLALGIAAGSSAPPASAAPLCDIEAIDAGQRVPPTSLDPYVEATRAAARRWSTAPTALVWPESAAPASPEVDAPARRELAALAGELGTVLITGAPGTSWDAAWQERRWNSAFRVDGRGSIQRYDKRRLVPFAEYWPWPRLDAPEWMRTSYVEAGSRPAFFRAGGCALGILICFEAQRPELARELAEAGADALLVLSNDAALPSQTIRLEVDQMRLRSAETGLPVLRAANAGSSLVAGDTATLVSQREGALRVAIGTPRSAPARIVAPLLLLVCLIASLAIAVWQVVTSRRRSSS